MLTTLALAATIAHQQEPERIDIGMRAIAGQQVPLGFPNTPGPFDETTRRYEFGDWNYAAVGEMGVGPRYAGSGGWTDVAQAVRSATPPSPDALPYRVKVFLWNRVTFLTRDEDGRLIRRRSQFPPFHVDRIMEALVQFEAMAEAQANGHIDVLVDVERDDALAFFFDDRSEREDSLAHYDHTPIGMDMMRADLGARLNRDAFDSDDNAFRGPYHSSFLIHAGLEGIGPQAPDWLSGTPFSSIGYYIDGEQTHPEGLAIDLLTDWRQHLEMNASANGLALPAGGTNVWTDLQGPLAFFAYELPGFLLDAQNAATRHAERHHALVEPEAQRIERSGYNGFVDSPGPAAAGVYVRTESGSALHPCAGQELVEYMRDLGIEATGMDRGGYIELDFDNATGGPPTPVGTTDFRDQRAGFEAVGAFRPAEAEQDGDIAFELFTSSQRGHVDITDRFPTIDPVTQDVQFEIKRGGTDPILLALETNGGKRLAAFPIPLSGSEQWQTVIVDLQAGDPAQPERVLIVATDGMDIERTQHNPTKYAIRSIAAVPGASATHSATPEQYLTATSPTGEILAALQSSDVTAILHACAALNELALPESVPLLLPHAQSSDPSIAFLALNALHFQGGEIAASAIARALTLGPFDHSLRFAAWIAERDPSPALVAPLGTLLSGQTWRTRRAGPRALDKIDTVAAAINEIGFMLESDTACRYAVVLNSDPTKELVADRLLWAAVNDPSQYVRQSAAWMIIQRADERYRDEGYASIRDEAEGVRLFLVERMAEFPNPSHREALRLAVVDSSPFVRAAAAAALGAQAEPIDPREIQNLFNDQSPDVLLALLRLAKAKEITIPEPRLAELALNPDLVIARLAKELAGP